MKDQNYKNFLILDFEATCERGEEIEPQEIIELPCLKVNASTLEVESIFHKYIRPTQPLTPFCTELTGITQSMVDNEPLFQEVFASFLQWGKEQNLWDTPSKSIFVTCGDWDLKTMLPKQCKQLDIPVPSEMKEWINIKRVFAKVIGIYPKKDLLGMMRILRLKVKGRLHSGIDDCKNIYTILCELIRKRDCVFYATSRLDI